MGKLSRPMKSHGGTFDFHRGERPRVRKEQSGGQKVPLMASLLYCLPLGSNWLQSEGTTKQFNTKLRELKDDNSAVVFIGQEKCGKTQLLFQAAVSYASQNYNVTFISRYPLNHIPLPVHGMIRPETAGQLETLTFLYMNTTRDVVQYCSSIHTKSVLPDVVIVDDFQYYLNNTEDSSQEVGCALLSAQLVDAMAFTRSKGCLGILMLSCTARPKFVPSILKQFKFGIANIARTSEESEEFRICLTLRDNNVTVVFTKQELGLFLKQITFHDTDSNNTRIS